MKNFSKRTIVKIISLFAALMIVVTGINVAADYLSGVVGTKNKTYKSLYEQMIAEKGFIYGVNVPWAVKSTAIAIGGSTVDEIVNGERLHKSPVEDYRKIFTNCKAIGYDAVKIWLFEGCNGIKFTQSGDIIGFDEYFMDDFDAVMKLAREIGIAIDITVLPHQETFLQSTYKYGEQYGELLYNRLTQFVVNPDYRKNYIDKILTPICEHINENYRDVILSVTSYCEPEGDTYGEGSAVSSNYVYGTSWDTLCDFMNEVADCVHKYLPNVPVTANSGFNPYETHNYNEVNLDIIGVDVYNNTGSVPDPESSMVNKPMWLTEFGPDSSDGYDHDDSFQIAYMLNFLNNAKSSGYTGAFYWAYNDGPPLSLVYSLDTYSALRPVASVIHRMIIDRDNELAGIEAGTVADKPALLCSDDEITLQWIASRDAESYTVYASQDGGATYKTVATIEDPEATITNEANICSFDLSTINMYGDITYKVSVKTYDGLTATSDPMAGHISKLICSEEENLVKNGSFESGFDNWTTPDDNCVELIEKTDVGTTQSGNYCACMPGDRENHQWHGISQTFDVEPNTTYRVTFYSKVGDDKYNRNFKITDNANSVNYLQELLPLSKTFAINTYTFTTASNAMTATISFVSDYDKVYIDSVYVFKE